MRAVIQRVSSASVDVEGVSSRECARIDSGLLVYLGVDRDDGEHDVKYLADKVRYLRIFPDESGKLNLDVGQASGRVLVVSAFTLQADARRGRRPSFDQAAGQDRAAVLYQMLCDELGRLGLEVSRGSFGDEMSVHATNAGPVCILMESRRAF